MRTTDSIRAEIQAVRRYIERLRQLDPAPEVRAELDRQSAELDAAEAQLNASDRELVSH